MIYFKLILFKVILFFFLQISSVISSVESNSSQFKESRLKKKILVFVFPGGRSHNFVMKELMDYSLQNQDKFQFEYHILVHNWDSIAWEKNAEQYTIHSFGDLQLFDSVFNNALEMVRKDPIFGYANFNQAMIHIYEQFLESKLTEKFRAINFDMLITDIPNFISPFLRTELKIKYSLFLTPPCLPNLFYEDFEFNPSYTPAIGSIFTDIMTFSERFQNFFYVRGAKVVFKIFMTEQVNTFKRYGYDFYTTDVFIHDSLILIQMPFGLAFNFASPPNIIRLNAVTPKPAKPLRLSNSKIDAFLNKYPKNIYFSQGTIVKIIDFEKIIGVFHRFPQYGFVLAFKKKNVPHEIQNSFPENVFFAEWVNQNDLLGDSRIHGFITHGGINSVSESIYHHKPMITLGVTIDQLNTAGLVRARDVGIVISRQADITVENISNHLDVILIEESKGNKYIENCKKVAHVMRANEPATKTFNYWINHVFEVGYEHMLIKAYTQYAWWEIYNFDLLALAILTFLIILKTLKWIFIKMFCTCHKRHKKRVHEKEE
jgi:hypothetical protein